MNILVRNLPRAVTERELAQMFLKFGKVKSFNIVTDQKTGVSKGFGFVDMPEQSEAEAAIKALDGKVTRGQRIRVKNSTKSSQALKEYKPEGTWEKHSQPREVKGVHKERSSTGRPTKRSYERPTGRTTDRPTERSTGRPTRRFTEKPAERSTERSTGRPTRRFTEKPAERRTGRSTEKSTQRPAGRPTERSNARSTGRPAGRPTGRSKR